MRKLRVSLRRGGGGDASWEVGVIKEVVEEIGRELKEEKESGGCIFSKEEGAWGDAQREQEDAYNIEGG